MRAADGDARDASSTEAPIWGGATVRWSDQSSWMPRLSCWLDAYLEPGGLRRVRRRGRHPRCDDDLEWLHRLEAAVTLDLETLTDWLAEDLRAAALHVFHGGRPPDAAVYHREGLRRVPTAVLAHQVRALVASEPDLGWIAPTLDARLARPIRAEADRLFVGLDEHFLVDQVGHYLLYGSEWIQGVLGWEAQPALLRRGVPTILTAAIPLEHVTPAERQALASHILQEWSRQQVVRDGHSPQIDCSFALVDDIPSAQIVGHSHPARIFDPLHHCWRANPLRNCSACRRETASDSTGGGG